MMKNFIRVIALIGVIAAMVFTAACNQALAGDPSPTYVTGTDSEADLSAQAQSDPAAETTAKSADQGAVSAAGDTDYKTELIGRWNLSAVYKDGEERRIAVEYGSIIRQTGAYIEFADDDTFQCILGFQGCKGTYVVEDGNVTLHITTKYDGSDEGKDCDENETLDWDHEAGTLAFDFYNVTNIFTKRDQ